MSSSPDLQGDLDDDPDAVLAHDVEGVHDDDLDDGLADGLDEDLEDDDLEDLMIIRAKWSMDGAKTLTEAADKLREMAAWLDGLAASGHVLEGEVQDDYGHVRPPT